jgi:hypothetical protein
LVATQPLHGAKLPDATLYAYDQVIAPIPGPLSVLLLIERLTKYRETGFEVVPHVTWDPGTFERP